MSEGCTRDVYIVSLSKQRGGVMSAGPTVPSPPPQGVMTLLVTTADGYFSVVVYCMIACAQPVKWNCNTGPTRHITLYLHL